MTYPNTGGGLLGQFSNILNYCPILLKFGTHSAVADGGFWESTPTGGITNHNIYFLLHHYVLFMNKICCGEKKLV